MNELKSTVTKMISFMITEEEAKIIRRALCDASMKQLMKAHKVEAECEEKGLKDETSWIYMKQRDKIRSIIDLIDETL